jgi:hypothetical protein
MQRSQRQPLLRISETREKPITTNGRQITPIGRVFQVSWRRGMFLWQQPVAVEVRQGDMVRHLPIPNVTRRATTGIILAALALAIAALSTSRIRRKNSIKRRRLS